MDCKFSKLVELRHELSLLRPLTTGELDRLREEFTTDYTYNSTAIEGNTLTLRETALVLEGLTIAGKPLHCHLEAVGHREAFTFIQENLAAELSESFIKQVHTLVLMDRPRDAGTYRKLPVRISGAVNTPADPVMIPELMERLSSEYLSDERHIIIKAAVFHLKFEGIHPFVDGNGRTGRLLLNMSLMKEGYLPVNIKYSDRIRYYNAFGSYYDAGDPEPMIELLTEYEAQSLTDYISLLRPNSTP